MKIPKLIYGEDNGYCSLWDITLGEYNHFRERINKAHDIGKDDKAEELEKELASHEIDVPEFKYEFGYIPDYAGYLAKVFKIDVDSN